MLTREDLIRLYAILVVKKNFVGCDTGRAVAQARNFVDSLLKHTGASPAPIEELPGESVLVPAGEAPVRKRRLRKEEAH